MRRMMWVPLVLLAGGCEAQICALLGEFVGAFEGDLAGDVSAIISVDPEDDSKAIAEMELDGGRMKGKAPVSCDDGELTLDLTDTDLGDSVGTVTGLLEDGTASGAWELFSGESGTWSY
jgi:hypothetical protein